MTKTVVLKDAMLFFNMHDWNPINGTAYVESPMNTNSRVTVDTGKKVYKTTIKQIDLLIFKLNNKMFGLINKYGFHTDDDWTYWNEVTWNEAGHYLQENFPNLVEKEK